MLKKRLREVFVESPDSFGERARAKRADRLLRVFPDLSDMRVLDLGGTASFWERLPVNPTHVTTLNSVAVEASQQWHSHVVGDACEPPDHVLSGEFDLVFSNSTIEHVGDRPRRAKFAEVARSLGPRHWIQTPNRWFPIEPHVLFPFQQFFPLTGRALVHRYWPLVHTRSPSVAAGRIQAGHTELMDRAEMTTIFPDSRIESEVVVQGLPPKSLIAIRD